MNIFRRELKTSRKALIIWSVCMFLLVISGMAKYTAYSSGTAFNDIFSKIPTSLKALLGIGSFDVTTPIGFFGFLFPYVEVTAAIHAVLLGAGIIAKEENDKTTEFLMVKPVSRTSVITAKLTAALFNVVVINIVSLFSCIVMVGAFNKGPSLSGRITVFIASMLVVQLIFLSLGAAIAGVLKNPRSTASLSTGVLLVTYMISKVTDLNSRLYFLNLISPLKYFNLTAMVEGNGLNIGIILASLALVAGLTALTYLSYGKRDLKV